MRVITDDDQSRSNGSDIQTIASAGIPVRDDRTNTHMHHKVGNRSYDGYGMLKWYSFVSLIKRYYSMGTYSYKLRFLIL